MRLDEARPGMNVRYVPAHANGDLAHPDCENGVVTSTNHRFVFVRFNPRNLNGIACDPDDLVRTA